MVVVVVFYPTRFVLETSSASVFLTSARHFRYSFVKKKDNILILDKTRHSHVNMCHRRTERSGFKAPEVFNLLESVFIYESK